MQNLIEVYKAAFPNLIITDIYNLKSDNGGTYQAFYVEHLGACWEVMLEGDNLVVFFEDDSPSKTYTNQNDFAGWLLSIK